MRKAADGSNAATKPSGPAYKPKGGGSRGGTPSAAAANPSNGPLIRTKVPLHPVGKDAANKTEK